VKVQAVEALRGIVNSPRIDGKGWGRRFDSGGGLHTKAGQRKRWSVPRFGPFGLAAERRLAHPLTFLHLRYGPAMTPDYAPSLLRSFERHLRAENRADHTP
jgi:hypothetical protein